MGKAKKENEEVVEEAKVTSKNTKQKEKIEKNKIEEDTNKKVQDIVAKAKEKGQITYGELATQLRRNKPWTNW